jgi:hypothetical protein
MGRLQDGVITTRDSGHQRGRTLGIGLALRVLE